MNDFLVDVVFIRDTAAVIAYAPKFAMAIYWFVAVAAISKHGSLECS